MAQQIESIYGKNVSMNSQAYIDVRVLADFYSFVKGNGSTANSVSAVIKEVAYWIHEHMVKEGMVKPCGNVEGAVKILEGAGFSIRQLARDTRNFPVIKGLRDETMQQEFGRVDARANADVLLTDEDMIRQAAEKFLGADEKTALERDALASLPTNLLAEEEDEESRR